MLLSPKEEEMKTFLIKAGWTEESPGWWKHPDTSMYGPGMYTTRSAWHLTEKK